MFRHRFLRLLLATLFAALASLAAGAVVERLIDLWPCGRELLSCSLEDAVGGYGVAVFVPLSALIYAVVLSVACNRTALAGAACLLLMPLVVFVLGNMLEIWETAELGVYAELRACFVAFLPPFATILTQWLILALAQPRIAHAGGGASGNGRDIRGLERQSRS